MRLFEKYGFLVKERIALLPPQENGIHLREAIAWLYRAQDATTDRGVSHSYLLGKGWMPSYPETTGYIIPTLLNWYSLTGEEDAKRRALDMADWELSVQLPDGAIPALSSGEPVVFDTGQVVFGWLAAFDVTGDERYRDAAMKAAVWLISQLDENRTWSRFGNPGQTGVHTYNVRVAWAVLALAEVAGEVRFRAPMAGFLDWSLGQESGRGWFNNNCLTQNDQPLLHTIAYTSQGLLECGVLLNDQRCIDAAARTSDELVKHVASDGRLPGRFDDHWRPAESWCCLTGMAQTAIVWQRLDRLTGDGKYVDAVARVNRFLKRSQDLNTANPGVRGGIKGSFPINGDYGSWRVLNWATKFFIDDLLLESYPSADFPLY